MTVGVETTDYYYTANGVSTVFAFIFSANSASEIDVFVDGVEVSGYTLSVTPPFAGGGNVIFNTPPAANSRIAIIRNSILTQEANYSSVTEFNEKNHETALDKIVYKLQDLQRRVSKAIRFPDHASMANFFLPLITALDAGKILVINDTYNGIAVSDVDLGSLEATVATTDANALAASNSASAANADRILAQASANTAISQAAISQAAANASLVAAGNASAIAAGSLFAYTTIITPGTVVTAVNGGGYEFLVSGTINLPVPTAGHAVRCILAGPSGTIVNLVRNGGIGAIQGAVEDATIIRNGSYWIKADGANWRVIGTVGGEV